MINYLFSSVNIILAYSICEYFVDMMFVKKCRFSGRTTVCAIAAAVLLTGFLPLSISFAVIQYSFICFLCAVSFFKKPKQITGFFLLTVLYFICNIVIVKFFEYLLHVRFSVLEILIYAMLLDYFLSILIKTAYFMKQKANTPYWLGCSTICVPIGTLFLILNVLVSDISSELSLICTITLVIIDILFYIFIKMFIDTFEKSLDSAVLREQLKAYRHQLNYSRNASNEFKTIRHDIKNNLNTVKSLISAGDSDAVIEFIDKINGSTPFNKTLIDSGNEIIDCIINYKISEAAALGINIKHHIKIPETLNVNPFDITIIIGNLLDNAISAVSENGIMRISANIQYSKGTLIIDITNPIIPSQREFKRGTGLKNVENVVRKYAGEMIITSDEDIFEVQTIIII